MQVFVPPGKAELRDILINCLRTSYRGGNASPSSTCHEIQTGRYRAAAVRSSELSSTSLHVCHSSSYTPLPAPFESTFLFTPKVHPDRAQLVVSTAAGG